MDENRHDKFSPGKRSEIMSHVRSRDTKPERVVRSALHRRGFRFRIHSRRLPGSPDIVLPKYKTAVFVHGCFWHQHPNCRKATIPRTNAEKWELKLRQNVLRDEKAQDDLKALGWFPVVLWECELRKDFNGQIDALIDVLRRRIQTVDNALIVPPPDPSGDH
jgi:DNA mismatch endonuclease (patch repair protein)